MAADPIKGAPPAGLYLKVGPDLALDRLIPDLRQIFMVINRSPYERNMHVMEISGAADDTDFQGKAGLLFDIAKQNGIACLMRGCDPALAKQIGAEGFLAADGDVLKNAQDVFGDDGIAGLYCGTSQEMACFAHDENADFVSFGTGGPGFPQPDVLRFWTILSDKPALIEGAVTNDYCGYFIESGASFIDAADYIWGHGKGVMQGTVNMLHAIDLALENMQSKKQ